jgi:hypothetical protein
MWGDLLHVTRYNNQPNACRIFNEENFPVSSENPTGLVSNIRPLKGLKSVAEMLLPYSTK